MKIIDKTYIIGLKDKNDKNIKIKAKNPKEAREKFNIMQDITPIFIKTTLQKN